MNEAAIKSMSVGSAANRISVWWGLSIIGLAAVVTVIPAEHLSPQYNLHWDEFFRGITRSTTDFLRPATRALTVVIEAPIYAARDLFLAVPWLSFIALITIVAYTSGGLRTAGWAVVGLTYIAAMGLWAETMSTLAIITFAVPIAAAVGFLVGILAFWFSSARRAIEALLDVMQTVPTFAYLIPMLALFGVGPVLGLCAAVSYAFPPVARAVILGLNRSDPAMLEAAEMAGNTKFQQVFWIRLPAAVPTILLGLNQTIMAVLSMVVIASIMGGLSDLGWTVYSAMKKALFGQSVVAGIAISIIAILFDRISSGFSRRPHTTTWRLMLPLIAAIALVTWVISMYLPDLGSVRSGQASPLAASINAALNAFTRDYFWLTSSVSDFVVINILLPLTRGAVSVYLPMVLGEAAGINAKLIYLMLAGCIAILGGRLMGAAGGAFFAGILVIYGLGLTGMPWILTVVLICAAAWYAGGARLAAWALVAQLFILTAGLWMPAMMSLSLTLAGVMIASTIGILLGVAASESDWLSSLLKPLYDTLQTIPAFVYLIPAIMIFLVGDFAGLVAIVLYAFVPAARYTEHGLRSVSKELTEAVQSFGPSRWQMLLHVKIPQAWPEVVTGINQTMMMSFSMVIVASLVGAKGLGQEIMMGLSRMDPGRGFTAGIAIALLAMLTDRILRLIVERIRS